MDNANSAEYLEKIKVQVIENLKKTTFAPSVQMQDVPRDSLMGDLDEEEAELDDADEDENMDVRNTERRRDQHISRDDELDESEDEEGDRANGVHPANGGPKRRNIMDYQNPNAVDDMDVDSAVATPEQQEVVGANVMVTEANAEVNAEVMDQKTSTLQADPAAEAGPSNAASRADSPRPVEEPAVDVDMTDVEPATVEDAPVAAAISTPPRSPSQAAESAPADPVAEDKIETTADVVAAKEEGEAEREEENVTAEASAEIAEQSQP